MIFLIFCCVLTFASRTLHAVVSSMVLRFLTLSLCTVLCAKSAETKRGLKNVLYLLADDLRPDISSAYGQSHIKTPYVDRLSEGSLVFAKAYCQQAVCGPSRNSFMTGRRPHHTNVLGKKGVDFRMAGIDSAGVHGLDWVTLPGHFKAAGFTTLGGGKTFSPRNEDYPRSWSTDMEHADVVFRSPRHRGYFPFAYYLSSHTSKLSPIAGGLDIPAPCPGVLHLLNQSKKNRFGAPIDVWCPLDLPDKDFYDYQLAINTIVRMRYAAKVYRQSGKPFFIMSG